MKHLPLLLTLAAALTAAAKEKVILDTDIGADLDDQLCVAYVAQEPECELLGITTVGPNADVRAEMASVICRASGRPDVKIYPGVAYTLPGSRVKSGPTRETPFIKKSLAKWSHENFTPDNTAIDFMRKTIRENPHQVTLLAVGHYTNVAALFSMDPEIPALLKQLVLMGGNFKGEAEWNCIADPLATAIIYGAAHRPRPPRLMTVGTEVTCKTTINEAEARAFFTKAKSLEAVGDLSEGWLQERHIACFHDPLAAVCIFHPEVCKYRDVNVKVSLTPAESAGWTLVGGWWDNGNKVTPHTIATDVDVQLFLKHYLNAVK